MTARTQTKPATKTASSVRAKVWVERDGRVVLSDWRVALLRAIDETGSLASAAARMDAPYRTAWYKLKEMERELDLKLVETQSGGPSGGGSALTPVGRSLVERFERVCNGVNGLVRERFEAELGDLIQ